MIGGHPSATTAACRCRRGGGDPAGCSLTLLTPDVRPVLTEYGGDDRVGGLSRPRRRGRTGGRGRPGADRDPSSKHRSQRAVVAPPFGAIAMLPRRREIRRGQRRSNAYVEGRAADTRASRPRVHEGAQNWSRAGSTDDLGRTGRCSTDSPDKTADQSTTQHRVDASWTIHNPLVVGSVPTRPTYTPLFSQVPSGAS